MPRFPNFSARVGQVGGSVFERFKPKMAAKGDALIKLHIGDTFAPPKYRLALENDFIASASGFNQYCNTFGIEEFRDALCKKLLEDNELKCRIANIQVTAGSTNALSASMQALIGPDEEVLVLTPAWPFFFGMVKIAGGKVVEVPFYSRLFDVPDLDIVKYLNTFLSEKTVALYLNTPNNPSGKVLTRLQIEQVADFCRENNLWIISDEAYDGLTFDDRPHISIASLPDMFQSTISVFTFSKVFMFAGLRLGYAVADENVISNLNKMLVHQLYSAATISQQMMLEPLQRRHVWQAQVREGFQSYRDIVIENLTVDFPIPEGTYFVMFSTEPYLRGRDYWEVIESCLDAGISVAPGDSFGQDYKSYIRLCFTGETPERLKTGLQQLNKILL